MATKTPWFPGSINPVRVGLYERDMRAYYRQAGKWSWWDGKRWHGWGGTPSIAVANGIGGHISCVQDMPWRGLLRRVRGTAK